MVSGGNEWVVERKKGGREREEEIKKEKGQSDWSKKCS
jgi:hypothetical protein